MSTTHQKLKASIRKLEQINKIEGHVNQLKQRLTFEENALQLMEKTLAKEQRDVEILEKEGLTSMFRKFLGDREEKLEKEREEYLRASLRFNELYKSVELIHFELDLLEKKQQVKEATAHKIKELMQKREKELIALDAQGALALKSIHDQADKLSTYSVEVEEAYKAGEEALEYVSKAERFLLTARKLGQSQRWGGRYPGDSRTKFGAIDSARKMAYQSRHALIRFGNELKDVYADYELQFNMTLEDFGNFANVFFDSLITDYFIQQKITKSLINITDTRKNVEVILNTLNTERSAIADKETSLAVEREKIILSD